MSSAREDVLVAGGFGQSDRLARVGERLAHVPPRRVGEGAPGERVGLVHYVAGAPSGLAGLAVEPDRGRPVALHPLGVSLLDQAEGERIPVAAGGERLVARRELPFGLREVGDAGAHVTRLAERLDEAVDAADRLLLQSKRITLAERVGREHGQRHAQQREPTNRSTKHEHLRAPPRPHRT